MRHVPFDYFWWYPDNFHMGGFSSGEQYSSVVEGLLVLQIQTTNCVALCSLWSFKLIYFNAPINLACLFVFANQITNQDDIQFTF